MPRIGTLALIITALVATLLGVTTPPAGAASYNYGQFSMMTQRHAGQLESGGQPASQWAWSPQGGNVSRIQWGDPADWPPTTYERFERVGDWVLLDGYGDTESGEFLNQVVTQERIGNVNCQNMVNLPYAGGRQHYVKWNIPTTAYCLEAWGHMIYQGVKIDFYHKQVWFPPSGPTCTNSHYTNQVCIKQYEIWRDNNGNPGGPLVERHRRDNVLALGRGPGFFSHSYLNGWHAELWADWAW